MIEPAAGGAFEVERLPDGRTSLVFRTMQTEPTGDVCAAGPRSLAHFKHVRGVARAVMVQFKPGWSSALLGVAANELTDRIIPLEELWGSAGAELTLALLEARTVPRVLDTLARALAARAQQAFEPASARLARRAVRLLEGNEVRVEKVATLLGVTGRHLRRAFQESVGIGPKEFARTVRLQRAVRKAATSEDWARIAAEAGYYDQAHLIADFRQLVGLTPGAFAKRAQAPADATSLQR